VDERPLPTPTLGERLAADGRAALARLQVRFPWERGLEVLARHVSVLAAPGDERFARFEVEPVPRASELAPPALPPRIGPGTAGDPAGAVSRGRPIPADIRNRLREVAGPGADAMRVHDGGAADTIARRHRADAVTLGRDVYLREGRLDPDSRRGFGLLAHEAVHVSAQLEPGAGQASDHRLGREESLALGLERAVRAGGGPAGRAAGARPGGWFVGPPPRSDLGMAPAATQGHVGPLAALESTGRAASGQGGLPAGTGSVGAATGAAAVPAPAPAAPARRAATDRDATPAAAPAAPVDLEALRHSVLRDLMHQLRTEFERGG
jgi:hypothetical protein